MRWFLIFGLFFFCFENVQFASIAKLYNFWETRLGFPFLYNVITSSIDTRSLGKKKNFTTFPVILFTWNKATFDHCAKKISKKIPYCDKDRLTLSRRKFLLSIYLKTIFLSFFNSSRAFIERSIWSKDSFFSFYITHKENTFEFLRMAKHAN